MHDGQGRFVHRAEDRDYGVHKELFREGARSVTAEAHDRLDGVGGAVEHTLLGHSLCFRFWFSRLLGDHGMVVEDAPYITRLLDRLILILRALTSIAVHRLSVSVLRLSVLIMASLLGVVFEECLLVASSL
jgi:hypothetical protein